MPNDVATTAQNLLNGIDYSALIGGPLQAAIKAQAMAALSTKDFIMDVGFDQNGRTKNVEFVYSANGKMQRLIVPVLVIVPIPCIEITSVSINFKANINASASQTTEESSSQQIGGELSATGKIGWGPFSLEATLKASYSSKQDSKATQDSRYSVEYTQNVAVEAGQAGIPAGLAVILNILSSSASSVNADGELQLSPTFATFDASLVQRRLQMRAKMLDASGCTQALVRSGALALSLQDPPPAGTTQDFQLTILNKQAMRVSKTPVTFSFSLPGQGNPDAAISQAFTLSVGEVGQVLPWRPDGTACTVSDGNGSVFFQLALTDPAKLKVTTFYLNVKAIVGPEDEQLVEVPIKAQNLAPSIALSPATMTMVHNTTTAQELTVSVNPVKKETISLAYVSGTTNTAITVKDSGGTELTIPCNKDTGEDGQLKLSILPGTASAAGSSAGVTFTKKTTQEAVTLNVSYT